MKNSQSGFTLIELSIILVIIGLVVGGIAVGGSMLRAAELRAVVSEYESYKIAVTTFKDKYFQLPGDLDNATQFWGEAHATPATCITTASTGTETCDGNGNGKVGSTASSHAENYERFRFWQHLANARLINGHYNGVANTGEPGTSIIHDEVGIDLPSSKMTGGGFIFTMVNEFTQYCDATNIYWFEGECGHMFLFGRIIKGISYPSDILTPKEAWNIDKKIDDGFSGQGNVLTMESHTNCNTTAVAATAEYDLTNSDVACYLIFREGF